MNGENMKIICLEENYLDSELGRACMPVALEQAPFLGDWGKTVADGHNPDRLPSAEVNSRLSMFAWGWHHEAGIHLLRLMLSGAFDKYPHLQVISGHWGEMLPFWLQRLDDRLPLAATGLSRTLTRTFKEHVYVTPSGMLTLPHFKFIYELMGAERILFSVDYPYQTLDGVKTFIDSLPVNKAEKEAIAFRNAERLLGITV